MLHAATSANANQPRFTMVLAMSEPRNAIPIACVREDVAGKKAVSGPASMYWIAVVDPLWKNRAATGRWYQRESTVVIPLASDRKARASQEMVTTEIARTVAGVNHGAGCAALSYRKDV